MSSSTVNFFGLGASSTTNNFAAPASTFGQKVETATNEHSKVKDLADKKKEYIASIITKFRKPMDDGLNELDGEVYKTGASEKMKNTLKQTTQKAQRLITKQDALLQRLKSLREKNKENLQHAKKFGINGFKEIKQIRDGVRHPYGNEHPLPLGMYHSLQVSLDAQVARISSETKFVTEQIEAASTINERMDATGLYGERTTISPHQLRTIMQRQNDLFMDIAAKVAEVREKADKMRSDYLRRFPGDDPFICEEEEKIKERKRKDAKSKLVEDIKAEEDRTKQQQPFGIPKPDQQGSKSTFEAAATPAGGFVGFGGFAQGGALGTSFGAAVGGNTVFPTVDSQDKQGKKDKGKGKKV